MKPNPVRIQDDMHFQFDEPIRGMLSRLIAYHFDSGNLPGYEEPRRKQRDIFSRKKHHGGSAPKPPVCDNHDPVVIVYENRMRFSIIQPLQADSVPAGVLATTLRPC